MELGKWEAAVGCWVHNGFRLSQMIVEPELRVADFAKAGADIISVHCEGAATIHLHRTLNQVRHLGLRETQPATAR